MSVIQTCSEMILMTRKMKRVMLKLITWLVEIGLERVQVEFQDMEYDDYSESETITEEEEG